MKTISVVCFLTAVALVAAQTATTNTACTWKPGDAPPLSGTPCVDAM
jgi:hypothetical protein